MHTATKMATKKPKKQGFGVEIAVPQGVSVELKQEGDFAALVLKKGAVQNKRKFDTKQISIKSEAGKIMLSAPNEGKRNKKVMGTFAAHVKNMISGLESPHVYKLKICAGHFPMQVTLSGSVFTIKNFLGEALPRTLKIKEGAKVKISGTEIVVESSDIEIASQAAASIESLSRVRNKDSRIFQDGIYIVEKDGKPI